jgi:hypothetical protein
MRILLNRVEHERRHALRESEKENPMSGAAPSQVR